MKKVKKKCSCSWRYVTLV